MTTTIVDGRAIAKSIQDELANKISSEKTPPRLDIIVVGTNTVTSAFVKSKKRFAEKVGVDFVEHVLEDSTTTEKMVSLIEELSEITNGIVVQLPLPEHIDVSAVLSSVPPEKDIDVLSGNTFGRFVAESTQFVPPVAGAVKAILDTHDIVLSGMKAVIIGKGRLVGAPVRTIFEQGGADITILDSATDQETFETEINKAEIIVSGVGIPNLVRKEHITKGVILIDAGTSGSSGTIIGDICMDCIPEASLVSKTPGGVGPITVAILFRNLVIGTYS